MGFNCAVAFPSNRRSVINSSSVFPSCFYIQTFVRIYYQLVSKYKITAAPVHCVGPVNDGFIILLYAYQPPMC